MCIGCVDTIFSPIAFVSKPSRTFYIMIIVLAEATESILSTSMFIHKRYASSDVFGLTNLLESNANNLCNFVGPSWCQPTTNVLTDKLTALKWWPRLKFIDMQKFNQHW